MRAAATPTPAAEESESDVTALAAAVLGQWFFRPRLSVDDLALDVRTREEGGPPALLLRASSQWWREGGDPQGRQEAEEVAALEQCLRSVAGRATRRR